MAIAALMGVTLIGFLVIAVAKGGKQEPGMEAWFEGYSNTPAGPVALVAIHFKPDFPLCVWPGTWTYRLNSNTWELWTPPLGDTRTNDFRECEDGFPPGRDGRPIDMYRDFAVENTNDTWRIVMEVWEYPPAPLPIHLRLLVLWNRWTKPPPGKSFLTGPRYFLTNDTRKMN